MNKVSLVDPALDIEPSWESERLDLVEGFPIELPPSGRGLRAQRRRQQVRRRRRQRLGLGALAVSIVALLAAGLVEVTWRSHERRVAGPAAPPTRAVAALPPTAVVVQQDAAGAAVSITLLVAGPGGRGGHVLLIPPGTM